MTSTPDEIRRRVAARRVNESIKLTATLLNNLAVGLFIGGMVGPVAGGHDLNPVWFGFLTIGAIGLHLCGKLLLRDMKSED